MDTKEIYIGCHCGDWFYMAFNNGAQADCPGCGTLVQAVSPVG